MESIHQTYHHYFYQWTKTAHIGLDGKSNTDTGNTIGSYIIDN